MANVRPASVRPAIEIFRSGVREHDAGTIAEGQDFERRRKIEQEIALDKAIREGVAAEQARAQAPVQTGQPVPAAAPASPTYAPVAPDTGGDTAIGEVALEVAPNAPTQQPAITGYRPRASALTQRLAQTPGSGGTLLQMHREDQRSRNAAEIQAVKALHSGEPDVAAAIAERFGINIPPEIIRNRKFQLEMKNLGETIKRMGISDDASALSITRGYLEARSRNLDEQTALTEAMSKAQTPAAKGPRRVWSDRLGRWVEEPSEQFPGGRTAQPPGATPRPASAGGGGAGGSRQLAYARWRIETLVKAGVPEREAQQIVAGGIKGPTSRDAASIAARLFNATDDVGNRIYATYQDALKAARDALGQAAPSPAAKPRMRFDAQGNQLQ